MTNTDTSPTPAQIEPGIYVHICKHCNKKLSVRLTFHQEHPVTCSTVENGQSPSVFLRYISKKVSSSNSSSSPKWPDGHAIHYFSLMRKVLLGTIRLTKGWNSRVSCAQCRHQYALKSFQRLNL